MVRVSSSSRIDVSEVTLEFGWGTNMDMAALDVRERLDVITLPEVAGKPILLRYDPSLDPIMRIGIYGDPDLVRMRLIAEHEVVHLPSASVLSQLRRQRETRPPAPKLLAVVADPVFQPDDPRLNRLTGETDGPAGQEDLER